MTARILMVTAIVLLSFVPQSECKKRVVNLVKPRLHRTGGRNAFRWEEDGSSQLVTHAAATVTTTVSPKANAGFEACKTKDGAKGI